MKLPHRSFIIRRRQGARLDVGPMERATPNSRRHTS